MENLFWMIYKCETEEELHKLVQTEPLLTNSENWVPYGQNINNLGTFESQQNNPIPSLIEKVTNSIDSILLKECKIKGIDPKCKKAPKSMSDAVGKFFNINNGDFSEVTNKERKIIAEDIQVIATGDAKRPSITIYDEGEGQLPQKFAETFLSLHRGNKKDVRFVQGRFNMGSTGAVVFCGNYRYQLIASKLHDNLSANADNQFGFTLVRRHPLSSEEEAEYKTTWYEYFVVNGEIPKFQITYLDLGLYNRLFKYGTIVKLYSYQLPRGSQNDVTKFLARDLNQYFYSPALPFIVYEKRFSKNKDSVKTIIGNKTLITIDERDKKEQTISLLIEEYELGRIKIEITVFKKSVNHNDFIKEKSVVFTINGQVQATLPRRFISQELEFGMLKNHMLIHIDCTNMKYAFRSDLFMASRDRLKEGDMTQLVIDKIKNYIKTNQELKALNQSRKKDIDYQKPEDEEMLKKIMVDVINETDFLNSLRKDIISSIDNNGKNPKKRNTEKKEKQNEIILKRFPTIFKAVIKKKEKKLPINKKTIITFETDVEDEYFIRPKDTGKFALNLSNWNSNTSVIEIEKKNIYNIFEITTEGPTKGKIKVHFSPKKGIEVGDKVEVVAQLTVPEGELKEVFTLIIDNPEKEAKKPEINALSEKIDHIPKAIRVYKEKQNNVAKIWSDFGWKAEDVIEIIEEKGVLQNIAINMDSRVLERYLSKNKSGNDINKIKEKYFISIYCHAYFLFQILEKLNNEESVQYEFDTAKIVPLIFQYYGNVLLADLFKY
ncbi:hypothetical protein [Niallia sp. NCCP-28]|uniref:hypothetical protein n=1 Tax=Niallia sp. NCCP-28 TaxID=2934712 RepID=UPI00207DE518|nr:hypothetical protein [Niallia sp. NCCP-28]GKU82925.1 hypothetical protein NCCP28_23210 [Niallia sp. NCCP-28]